MFEIVEDCRVPGFGDFCALVSRRVDGSLTNEGYIEDQLLARKVCHLLNLVENNEKARREHSAGDGK